MTTMIESEQLYCSNCSDPVDEVDEDGCGRCCHDLPNPWHRGSDGLYTEPSDSEDAADEDEDEDEDEDRRPTCPYCGERRFRLYAHEWRQVTMTGTASGSDNEEYDDSVLWYDSSDFEDHETNDARDFEVQRVECVRCSNDVTHSISIEHY
jgi:hypothetical protein